ncbi:trypsin-like peptidase domain-containing protein [Crocosphaera sp.]|uniref:S1 family peptidase n=1 Tax=Crocosphaera sp. TaxID=2729996 RepID=UPI002610D964|nr:trypsin-like peptidase domain-containing protein [Crocosphaera sp.]MDJ0578598.1 trypsin-like peptidase domain-containing protein [Crocosphaera sp.]
MTFQRLEAIARIRRANDKVVGAGFLVSDKHILTCAHVVNAALGKPLNAIDEPDKEICLDFPLVASGKILKGKVVRWIPVQPSSSILPETGADMALLELESPLPEGIQPIRLITAENLWKHPFRVFGFPKGQSSGVYTDGIIREKQGNGRVQIDVLPSSAYRIEPGFSGSPVWDEQLDGVAGMTVAIDSGRPENRAAFIIPTTQLINACPELAEQAIPPCPYRGLFAFREQDAQYFFGRKTFTEELVIAIDRLVRTHKLYFKGTGNREQGTEKCPNSFGDCYKAVQKQSLVPVIGASGSGKSSVVFAGLIPQLRSQEGWLIESFRPGNRPLYNLIKKLVSLRKIKEIDPLTQMEETLEKIEQGKRKLRDVIEDVLERNKCTQILLIADQFEELYTLCQDNSERQLFLDQLLETVNQTENFKLVLTLRADFFGYALSYRPFADALQDADRKLGPMNHEELQEAIEKPAQLLGVRLESGLTERILKAVEKEPGNLPLLEFALEKMWAKQQNGQLTHQAYEDIGGVEKALAKYAQEQYEDLSEEDKEKAQQVFIQLVRPGEGTEDTRRSATRDEVREDNWDLVTKLASARLVVTNKIEKTDEKEETEQEIVEIIHEALIREWGTLRDWIEKNREFRTWQERLKVRIQEWETSERNDGALLQNVPLGEAEVWLQESSDNLSKSQRNYIELSLELRDRKQQEEKARRNRELEQEKKARKAAQTRTIVALMSTLVVGAFGIFANFQRQEAERKTTIVTLRQKAIEIRNLLSLKSERVRDCL